MMAPMVLARLIQAMAPRLGEAALVVGAATGYSAAILADIGAVVTALEPDGGLLATARLAWPLALPGAVPLAVQGPLAQGHADAAPYDVILIDGAIEAPSKTLLAQLAEGGRLALVQSRPGGAPRAMLGRKLGGHVFLTPIMDATAPALPGFAPAPSFVF
jgi:protein-L-isoaspartate(D-aspartate) O-methyltransferase